MELPCLKVETARSGLCSNRFAGKTVSRGVCMNCPKNPNRLDPYAAFVPHYDPVPRDQWPGWVKLVATYRNVGDFGIGDTVNRQLGMVGNLMKGILAAAKMSCGCDERRDEWNMKYPYEAPSW